MSCRVITIGNKEASSKLWSDIRKDTQSDEEADNLYSKLLSSDFKNYYGDWTPKTITFLRHGLTTEDLKDQNSGDNPVHLAKEGKEESKETATEINKKNIKTLYASPSIRAQETAQIIKKDNSNLNIITIDGLKPWALGKFQSKAERLFNERHFVENNTNQVPEGESFEQFFTRFTNTINDLREKVDEASAILTHSKGLDIIEGLQASLGKWNEQAIKVYFTKGIDDSSTQQTWPLKTWNTEVAKKLSEDGEPKYEDVKSYLSSPTQNTKFNSFQPNQGLTQITNSNTFTSASGNPSSGQSPLLSEDAPPVEDSKIELDKIIEFADKTFTKRTSNSVDEIRQTSINQLKALVSDIRELRTAKEQDKAYSKVLTYIDKVTDDCSKFINNSDNFQHKLYYQALQESVLIANSNQKLLPTYLKKSLTEENKVKFEEVQESLERLLLDSQLQALEFVKKKGVEHNFNPITLNDWIKIAFPEGGADDISTTGEATSPIDQLRDPLLTDLATRVKVADLQGKMLATRFMDEVEDLGSIYQKETNQDLSGKNADFMFNLDSKGNRLGMINPVHNDYYKLEDELKSALLDSKGKPMEYIPISSLKSARPEDIEFNKKLYTAKTALRKFTEPEVFDAGMVYDGNYHHLSDTYKNARAQIFQRVDGKSILRPDLSEDSPEVQRFRTKYQTWRDYWHMSKDKDKHPTGIVTKKSGWFPDNDHIEINRTKELTNPRYEKLMNPVTPLEKSQKKFYQNYMSALERAVLLLGPEAKRWQREGGLINVSNKLFKKASQTGILNTLKHNAIEWFTSLPKSNIEKTDDGGQRRQTLSMPYMASLRNMETIESLRKELRDLAESYEKGNLVKKDYLKQRKELETKLKIEDHKNAPEDLEQDPVKALRAFVGAATMYDTMSKIEGEILALRDVISQQILLHPQDPKDPASYDPNSQRKYFKTSPTGQIIRDNQGNPVWKAKEKIQTIKRIEHFLTLFYNESVERSTLDVIAAQIMKLTTAGV